MPGNSMFKTWCFCLPVQDAAVRISINHWLTSWERWPSAGLASGIHVVKHHSHWVSTTVGLEGAIPLKWMISGQSESERRTIFFCPLTHSPTDKNMPKKDWVSLSYSATVLGESWKEASLLGVEVVFQRDLSSIEANHRATIPITSNNAWRQVGMHVITGWWFGCHFLFSHILGMSSSQLTNSYFSEGWPNHQPDNISCGVHVPKTNPKKKHCLKRNILGGPHEFPNHNTHMLHGAGIFTNICPKNHPNVVKYTIHGAYGI